MTRTYRFGVSVRIGILSGQEDRCYLFKDILNAAAGRLEISGSEQSSFSYDVPQDGLGEISGYLHVNKTASFTEAAVRTWITDDRINGEDKWSPVLPGKNGNWKQHALINSIFADCNAGGTRLALLHQHAFKAAIDSAIQMIDSPTHPRCIHPSGVQEHPSVASGDRLIIVQVSPTWCCIEELPRGAALNRSNFAVFEFLPLVASLFGQVWSSLFNSFKCDSEMMKLSMR